MTMTDGWVGEHVSTDHHVTPMLTVYERIATPHHRPAATEPADHPDRRRVIIAAAAAAAVLAIVTVGLLAGRGPSAPAPEPGRPTASTLLGN
jgi:hypothetical protein